MSDLRAQRTHRSQGPNEVRRTGDMSEVGIQRVHRSQDRTQPERCEHRAHPARLGSIGECIAHWDVADDGSWSAEN